MTLWNLKHEAYLAGRDSQASKTMYRIKDQQTLKRSKRPISVDMRSETSSYSRALSCPTTNVRAQKSKITERHHGMAPKSTNAFWQLENFHAPVNGRDGGTNFDNVHIDNTIDRRFHMCI